MHNSDKLIQRLEKKGWSKEELEHAHVIFKQHELKHHIIHPMYDKLLHWTFFATILIGNLFIFAFLFPIMSIFNNFFSYFFVALLAGVMGLIYEGVIRNQTHLKGHHHAFISIVIPIISFISFILLILYVRKSFNLKLTNTLLLGFVYSVFLILPYYIKKIIEKFMP